MARADPISIPICTPENMGRPSGMGDVSGKVSDILIQTGTFTELHSHVLCQDVYNGCADAL